MNTQETEDLIHRLNRIQGQIEGLKKAIVSHDPKKNCSDILYQIKAVRSALKKVGEVYAEDYMEHCITDSTSNTTKKERVVNILKAMIKQ
jgi:DNA-binding FrmR family transcriptional regulator